MKNSLRNRIIAWFLVPTAIILILVALVSLYSYQRVTETLVVERDRDLARLSANLLGAELASYTDPLAEQYLALFDGIVVFSANGAILAAEPEEYARWRPNWFKQLLDQESFLSPEPVFSNVVTDGMDGERMIVVIIPTQRRDGQRAGGIAGLYHLNPAAENPLARSIDRRSRAESNVYLVDGQGQVIYHSDPRQSGADFSAKPYVRRVLAGEVGALRARDLEGREIVASFSPVPGTPWGLVAEESWSAVTQSSRQHSRTSLLLLALGVVTPTVLVALGTRQITRPIQALTAAAQTIAKGRFDQRIEASTGDELQELAQQFNLMAAQLQESYAHLEQKVDDRTRELATLNAIAAKVSQSLDLGEILTHALDEMLHVMGMTQGLAYQLEDQGRSLVLIAHRGLSEDLVRCAARQSLGDGCSGRAVMEGHPVLQRVSSYPENRTKELLAREGVHLVVSTPLMAKGKIVGAIELGSHALRKVTPEELSLLTAIGHQIGVAVENARLYEEAQQLAVVKERSRLARDLHDSVTQALYGVTLCAEAGMRQLTLGDAALASNQLREIRMTTEEALREMRLLIFELRPPKLTRDGLVAALQARLEAVEERVGLTTALEVGGNGGLSPEMEASLYRVAQEALSNVLKHARASHVSVRLEQGAQAAVLEIADDGTGFNVVSARECGGFGLTSMEERVARLGGTLLVESKPGRGTRIRVEVGR